MTENLVLQVPPFRGDLEREVDLIEEIARLAGYDAIPVTLAHGEVATRRPGPEVRLKAAAKDVLLGLGFFEVITYAFQPDRLGSLLSGTDAAPALRLANPLSEEQAMMRTSLLPGPAGGPAPQHLAAEPGCAPVRDFQGLCPPGRGRPAPGGALAHRGDVRRPGGRGLAITARRKVISSISRA